INRSGVHEPVIYDKITLRIRKFCYKLSDLVDPTILAIQVIQEMHNGISTTMLDSIAAKCAAELASSHPDYGKLAARIEIDNLHKSTNPKFSETMRQLHTCVHESTGKPAPLLSNEMWDFISRHADELDSMIVGDRD